jgi:hypothetical protein
MLSTNAGTEISFYSVHPSGSPNDRFCHHKVCPSLLRFVWAASGGMAFLPAMAAPDRLLAVAPK